MFSRPKILILVSLLFVALLNPKFNPYLLFKFLIFYHSSIYICLYIRSVCVCVCVCMCAHVHACVCVCVYMRMCMYVCVV